MGTKHLSFITPAAGQRAHSLEGQGLLPGTLGRHQRRQLLLRLLVQRLGGQLERLRHLQSQQAGNDRLT